MHALKALWPGSTIKRWLGSQPSDAKPVATPPAVPAAKAPAPAARVQTPVAKKPAAPVAAITPQPAPVSAVSGDDKFLHLPLKPIFDRLSPALQALANAGQITDTDEIALQIDNILAQLPGGVVRISFGELRHAAPAGTFGEQNSHDYTLIDVPLSEILARINPSRLSLRADRKRIEVPAEVAGVFGKNGNGTACIAAPEAVQVARSVTPAQPVAAPKAPQAPASMPTPPPRARVVIPPPPPGGDIIQFNRATTPAPAAPAAAEPSAIAMPPRVTKPAAPVAPEAPAAPVIEPSAPIPMPAMAKLAPAPVAPAAPVVVATPAAPAKPEVPSEPLVIPMTSLMDFWPAAIKTEIEQARPAVVSLAVPLSRLEGPMKTGKLNFTWNELRQWTKPNPLLGTSAQGETAIQLPLNVIAPLFFAHPTRTQSAKKKADVIQDIPDVFGSNSNAEALRELANVPVAKVTSPTASAAPTAAPLPPVAPAVAAQGNGATNLQLRMAGGLNGNGNGAHAAMAEPTDSPVLFAKNAGAVAAANGNGHAPAAANNIPKIDWTPDQAVKVTCASPSVAGALVVAADGLMVATQLSAQFKSDTLSAFVPQIFGRAAQSAAELGLPALGAVRLSFGDQQCEIFKTGKLYYVIIGKPGEELPTPILRKIAAELTKRN